jgi:hypothetical protein
MDWNEVKKKDYMEKILKKFSGKERDYLEAFGQRMCDAMIPVIKAAELVSKDPKLKEEFMAKISPEEKASVEPGLETPDADPTGDDT